MLFRIFIYNKYLCFFRVTSCQFSELIIAYNIRVMARLIIKNNFKLALNKNAKHKTHNFRNINTLITWIFAKFMRFSIKAKSVKISDEPLACQLIFSDTEPQFDNDDEK
ncbi:MAG: hypothetical protein KAV44_05515 [Bacteroidales bacterium]|nr:hypothetical protein [Bacteroidales bacterium]